MSSWSERLHDIEDYLLFPKEFDGNRALLKYLGLINTHKHITPRKDLNVIPRKHLDETTRKMIDYLKNGESQEG